MLPALTRKLRRASWKKDGDKEVARLMGLPAFQSSIGPQGPSLCLQCKVPRQVTPLTRPRPRFTHTPRWFLGSPAAKTLGPLLVLQQGCGRYGLSEVLPQPHSMNDGENKETRRSQKC